jgi:hypothetical protein
MLFCMPITLAPHPLSLYGAPYGEVGRHMSTWPGGHHAPGGRHGHPRSSRLSCARHRASDNLRAIQLADLVRRPVSSTGYARTPGIPVPSARSMRSARPGALIGASGMFSLMCRPTSPYGAPYNDNLNAGMEIDADSGESMKSSAAIAGFESAMRGCNRG